MVSSGGVRACASGVSRVCSYFMKRNAGETVKGARVHMYIHVRSFFVPYVVVAQELCGSCRRYLIKLSDCLRSYGRPLHGCD